MTITVAEPLGAPAVVAPSPSEALKVHPPPMAKRPRLTRGEGSSSTPSAVASQGPLSDRAPGLEVCAFDNQEVARGLFEEFIHPIDAEHVIEGNHQRCNGAVWTILNVSFSYIVGLVFVELLATDPVLQMCHFIRDCYDLRDC